MGMVPAQHVAHGGGAFPVGLVGGQIVLVHGVENPPVDGLQAVPHIGQRPSDDHGHGVLDVALFHFVNKLRGDNGLVGILNVLRLVVFPVLCQKNVLLLQVKRLWIRERFPEQGEKGR